MEALKNLNKLWRTSAFLPSTISTTTYSETSESEEESFFELELLMSRDEDNKANSTDSSRRVVHVEPEHSPNIILKSAPKLKVSLFRNHTDPKLKPKPKVDTTTTLISQNSSSPVSKPQKQSITKTEELQSDLSKRFSKDVMHKYLKLKLIALSLKSSSSGSSGFRVVCKQLGKCRSASSMGSRRDESLDVVEHDDGGIQSAILHCKRSFNSSRDSPVHSSSSSDSREQEQHLIT